MENQSKICKVTDSPCKNSPYNVYITALQLSCETSYYDNQKKILQQFMTLLAQGKVISHVTTEDMKQWLTSQAMAEFNRRYQKELNEGRDLCIAELVWEVNTHLNLNEMERELRQVGELPHHPKPEASSQAMVQNALEDIVSDITYLPASRPQSTSGVVVDLATMLLSIISNPANNDGSAESLKMPLVDLAMWVVTSSLMDLAGCLRITDAFQATKQHQILYSKPVGIRIVRSIHDNLLNVAGSPKALRKVLSEADKEVIGTAMTGITLSVCQLITGDQGNLTDSLLPSPVHHGKGQVIHSDTLNTIMAKLLGQISDAPSQVVSFLLCDCAFLVDLENHFSEVLKMSVSSREKEVNFSLQPAEVQQIVDSVYNQLAQRSDLKITLQTNISSKTQMMSRDIACLIVRAVIKLLPSLYSEGDSIRPGYCGGHCKVEGPKFENYWNMASTGPIPDALFLHTIDRLVCKIFPIKASLSVLKEDMRKHLCLLQQLWVIVQDLFIKAPKSKALMRALKKLPVCEQDMGMMDYELGGMLYHEYTAAFPIKTCLDIDTFIEDKELCFKVSRMVVEMLLNHWTPSASFFVKRQSQVDLVSATDDGGEVKVGKAMCGATFSADQTLGKADMDIPVPSKQGDRDYKSVKKRVRGFLRRVWNGIKRRATCICGCASPADD